MNSITEWLINEGIAHHIKHAENIIALLHLGELWNNKDYETIKQRARDYRKFRRGTKDSSALCAQYVLEGKEPPEELFDGTT